jgi:HD-like signal output (HDOD) protein
MPTTLTRSFQSAEELIARTQDLPSLPAVVMQVYQMVDDPECTCAAGRAGD